MMSLIAENGTMKRPAVKIDFDIVSRTTVGRRSIVLGGVAATCSASLIAVAHGQPAAGYAAFLGLSSKIAGRQVLDLQLARRLYAGLVEDDRNFEITVQALYSLLAGDRIQLPDLQKTLDDQKSPLANIPHKIASAWFLGIVGGGPRVRVLAYENALNAVIVSDVLKPPTYAYGVYGSWSAKPV
jgi:hypothetical protein